ncbi:MAG TPA: tetratricopeptide repeat protein [Gemmatimonadaceae bacterium]|nr:tetratricopeptide repeat protein [Gemmatimonadaceae bacterium]
MNEQYNLLAEFGRVDGQTVYLARDRATGEVAIARRRSDDPSGPLTISHALDATVPADGAVCSFCMDDLRTWGRFCPSCGREVFGAQPASADSPTAEQLLDAVRHAAEGRFDILGSMPRAEGGDTIYFAVDLNTADVVALLLNREGIEADGTLAYSLELPLTLSPVAKGPVAAPAVAAKPAPPLPPKADSFTAMFGAVAPPPPAPVVQSVAPPVVMPPPVVPPVVMPPPVVPPPPVSATLAPMPAATPSPERTRRTTAPIPEPSTPVLSPPPARQRQAVPKGVVIAGIAAVLGVGVLFVVLALRPKPAPAPIAVAQDTTSPAPAPAATADTAKPQPSPDTTTVAAETPPPVAPAPVAPAVTKPTPTPRRKRLTGRDTLGLAEAIHDCSSSTLAGDWSTAAPVCERAAAAGDPDAELSLGMMYQRGNGVPGSLADAFKWFQKASDGGSVRATNYLAWAYANGDGVKRDGAAALKLFHKSATSGNAQGEYGLGMMYANGTGAMRSDSLAVLWFRKAAAQNDPLARSELTRRGLTP